MQIGANCCLFLYGRAFVWKPHGHEDGISLQWKDITMHAISNDPSRCVYMMIDFQLLWQGVHPVTHQNGNGFMSARERAAGGANEDSSSSSSGSYGDANEAGDAADDNDANDNDNNDDDDDDAISEVWLLPSDRSQVDVIYEIMSQCQVANPDPEDDMMDGSSDSEESFYEEDMGAAAPDAEQQAQDQMANLDLNDERFEDAD